MAEKRTTYKIQDIEGIGEVQIADEVVTIIAGLAATEVDGVASMAGNITNELVSKLGVKNLSKGVKVTVLEGVVTVDLTLNIEFGKNILEVSKKVQDKVKSSIENMTGLEVADVNIRIAGVDMETEKESKLFPFFFIKVPEGDIGLGGNMRRSEQREHIFKLLFMTQFNSEDEMSDQVSMYFETLGELEEKDQEAMQEKYQKILEKLDEIDQILNDYSRGWKTSRMSRVDLTALRLAVYEMKFDEDVPVGVAINEAVELAKMFGGDDSGSFVNGILGKIASGKKDSGEAPKRRVRPIRPRSSSVHPRKMHRNPKQRQSQKKTLIIN